MPGFINDQYNYARMVASSDGGWVENFVDSGSRVVAQWWLRSPGTTTISAATVDPEGYIRLGGMRVFFEGVPRSFRPALWLDVGERP